MSATSTPGSDCSCDQAPAPADRPNVVNRPGLPALAYRIGTQPEFLRRMLEQLPAQTLADGPGAGARPLLPLTTRSSDDPAIALLDAWATTLDVLTFYQERIANEGYLRTATERLSVLELARATGYELSPGVAAAAYLAFTLDDAPGSPAEVKVPPGTRVQSVPGPGQQPQTFETTEGLTARPEYNALRAATTLPQHIDAATPALYLQGTATQLQPGDAILVVGEERAGSTTSQAWDFRILTAVEPNVALGYTRVAFADALGTSGWDPSTQKVQVYALRQRAGIFGHNAPDWNSMSTDFQNKYQAGHGGGTVGGEWPGFALDGNAYEVELDAAYPKLLNGSWVVCTARVFRRIMSDTQSEHMAAIPVNFLFFTQVQLFWASDALIASHAEFALSGRTTTLELDQALGAGDAVVTSRRAYAVYIQSDPLALANLPIIQPGDSGPVVTAPVQDDSITLQRRVDGLTKGQLVAVTGKRVRARVVAAYRTRFSRGPSLRPAVGDELLTLAAPVTNPDGTLTWRLQDKNGVQGELRVPAGVMVAAPAAGEDPYVSEVIPLLDAAPAEGRTVLTLQQRLTAWYDPTTLSVSANVARATHGETAKEVLGGGDATRTLQRFTLKKPPLTYVSAPTPSGGASTLVVRVDGVAWDEQPSLYGLAPESQSYAVRLGADGKPAVIFGDGQMGARLPTGQENVTATYRSGTGQDGNVGAGTLSLLLTRPQGVQKVTNPLPASGGADPERLGNARVNAPLKVLTLDRIVSLQDYEDFARAFAGIGKAQAEAIWAGQRRIVHLTVAGSEGGSIDPAGPVYASLLQAIHQYGDPTQQVMVTGFTPRTFSCTALLITDRRYLADDVVAAAGKALTAAFTWQQRSFAQPVTAAELMAILQGVAGVVAVELTSLRHDDLPGTPMIYRRFWHGPQVPAWLGAARATWNGRDISPAELLLLNPTGITLHQRSN